jgi:ribulose-phosphate 3-epimerase
MVTFHLEAASNPVAIATQIRAGGARVGLAIKPNTPLKDVLPLLSSFDQLLIMTVEPGFGGQSLIEETLSKVAEARKYIDEHGLNLYLQVDGGIDEANIARVASYGADTFVAGSAIYKNPNRGEQIRVLRDAASEATTYS